MPIPDVLYFPRNVFIHDIDECPTIHYQRYVRVRKLKEMRIFRSFNERKKSDKFTINCLFHKFAFYFFQRRVLRVLITRQYCFSSFIDLFTFFGASLPKSCKLHNFSNEGQEWINAYVHIRDVGCACNIP